MRPIQALLILLVVILGTLYLARFRSRLLDRLFVLGLAALGVVMIAFPELSTRLANLLGVGRGADLLTYLGLLGLAFLCLVLNGRLRELRQQVTALARAIALDTAREPGQESGRSGSPRDRGPAPSERRNGEGGA